MHLLDACYVIGADQQPMDGVGRRVCTVAGAEQDGDRAPLTRGGKSGNDIRRSAAGRERDDHVARVGQCLELSSKDMTEVEVVGDTRDH